MLRLTAFPAAEGDCFLLEWGDRASPRRMLVDGGRSLTWRQYLRGWLAAQPLGERRIDLLVITHIDRDHIEGVLSLAREKDLGLVVGEVWFNAWRHIGPPPPPSTRSPKGIGVLSAAQGDKLSQAILARGWCWNTAFGGGAACIGTGAPPVLALPDGAAIRLLSPDAGKLRVLEKVWRKECRRTGLMPGGGGEAVVLGRSVTSPATRKGMDLAAVAERVTVEDDAAPNGSSIAFVFEFNERRILFAADAHPKILEMSLKAHYGVAPVRIDLFKASHHGSRGNITLPLCRALECGQALISTNGSLFGHPDDEAIARLILSLREPRILHFNYCSEIALSWNDASLMHAYGYQPTYPSSDANGFCIIEFGEAEVAKITRHLVAQVVRPGALE